MSGSDAFRRARQRTTQPSVPRLGAVADSALPFPTQLGDPNFSLANTPQANAMYPAAAGERSLVENQRYATNALATARAAGHDISLPQYDQLREVGEKGFLARAGTIGEGLLRFIDGGRQASNLLLQQLLNANAESAGELGVGDFMDALWMGVDDPEEFRERTGFDPTSGSHTLDLMGWAAVENEDNSVAGWAERIARGVAHFGLDVALDPLTYVTGGMSGLGRNVARAAGEKFSDDVAREMLESFSRHGVISADNMTTSYAKKLANTLDDDMELMLQRLTPDGGLPVKTQGLLHEWLSKKQGLEDLQPTDGWGIMQAANENLMEFTIRNRTWAEVGAPLIRRDTKAIAREALEELPKYAHGGIRISAPFTKASLSRGLVIPGTQGLGRKAVGDPFRQVSARLRKHSSTYNKLADKLDSSLNAIDRDRALLKGLGREAEIDELTGLPVFGQSIEGWQWHIARQSMDRYSNAQHKEELKVILNAKKEELLRLAETNGLDDSKLWPEIMNRLERRNVDTLLTGEANVIDQATGLPSSSLAEMYGDVDDKINEIADFLSGTFEAYHQQLRHLNPEIAERYIKNYVPHRVSEDVAAVLGTMAGRGATVSRKEMERLQKSNDKGGVFLAQLVNAITIGGRIETQLGASRAMQPRGNGRVAALTLTDNGTVMFDRNFLGMDVIGPEGEAFSGALQAAYMSVTEMNEALEPVLRDVAQRNGINLPSNWDGKVFNENPLEVASSYIDNLDDAISTWGMVEGLLTAGLAFKHSTATDVQGTLQAMYANILKNVEDGVDQGSFDVGDLRRVQPPASIAPEVTAAPAEETETLMETQRALRSWADTPAETRQIMDDFVAGKEMSPQTKAKAEAMANWFHRRSQPTSGLFRGMQVGSATPKVGESLDIPMANATKNINEAEQFAGDDGWLIVFDEATPAAFNPENTNVPLVSGRFTVSEVDEESRRVLVTAVHAENILPARPATLTPTTTPRSIPKLTRAAPKAKLIGYDEAAEEFGPAALPLRAELDATRQGLGDFDNAKELNEMVTVSKQEFRDLREHPINPVAGPGMGEDALPKGKAGWTTDDSLEGLTENIFRGKDGNVRAVLTIEFDNTGKVTTAAFGINATPKQRIATLRAMYDKLDGMVDSGKLKLDTAGVKSILNNEQMTVQGADFLQGYLKYRIRKLDMRTRQLLTKNPEEVITFQDTFDDMADSINLLFKRYGATINEDGTLNARTALIAGDAEFDDFFAELRKAAKNLKDEFHFETAVKLFKDMPEPLGLALDQNFVNPQIFALGGPAIEGLSIQTDIAKWMRQATRNSTTIYTPEGVAALKVATNSVLHWWKAMATIARPAFHVRNVIGGIWNNMIIGVGPQAYLNTRTHGITIRNALRKGATFDEAVAGLGATEAAVWKAAWDNDVLNGFATSEFRGLTGAEKRNRLAWAKVWDVDDFALTRIGGHFMESVEDFLRMSAFRTWYDPNSPGSAKVAAEMALAVHFDYSNLTPFETKVKSIIPFFVWIRRNLPLQLRQLTENPRMIQRYQHMMSALDDLYADDELGDMPVGDHYSAFAASTGWTVNRDTPFWARAMIDPDLPVRDLIDLPRLAPGDMFDWALNMMGPHISSVVNLNEQREFGDVNAPAGMNAVLHSLAAVGLYDRTMDGQVRVPYMMRTLQETILPFSREVIDPLTGGPTDPNRRAKAGMTPDTGFLQGGAQQLGSTALGALGVRLSPPSDVRSVAFRSNEEIDQIIKKLRLQGELPASESPTAGLFPQG